MKLVDYARQGDAKGFEKEFVNRIQQHINENPEHKEYEKEVYELTYLIRALKGNNS